MAARTESMFCRSSPTLAVSETTTEGAATIFSPSVQVLDRPQVYPSSHETESEGAPRQSRQRRTFRPCSRSERIHRDRHRARILEVADQRALVAIVVES